jgi:hypothetical protein
MANRADDWFAQATRDLDHARNDFSSGYHEWACYSAHQAAEKALYQHMDGEAQTTTPKTTAGKRSAVLRRSYGSVQTAFLDRNRAITELTECAVRFKKR